MYLFFNFALFTFTLFFCKFTWLSSIILLLSPVCSSDWQSLSPCSLHLPPCLMGWLFLGCWSSFLLAEHHSAEEAVGGPSCCPSWVSACARLVLPHVTQVPLTPAPTHLLIFSCWFWDGATGHLSCSLSLFKDTIEFLYLPMPGRPGMLRGADNIAAVLTRGQANEGETSLLP